MITTSFRGGGKTPHVEFFLGPEILLDYTRSPLGRTAMEFEFITVSHSTFETMIHDDQLIRNVEDEITLIGWSILMQPQRLKLTCEIITESPIQTEITVINTAEKINQGAHDGKDGRLFTPLFFRETARTLCDNPMHCMSAHFGFGDSRNAAYHIGNDLQQKISALVQSGNLEVSAVRFQTQRRINETDVPPRIPPRVLVARRQQDAATSIQSSNERLDRIVDGNLLDGPMDMNSQLCSVGLTWKEHCFADHRHSSK